MHGLALQVRGAAPLPIRQTAALASLLASFATDPAQRQLMEERVGASLDALLPVASEPDEGDDPDWLRAAEMLDDAPACPGERLLGQTLLDVVRWWRPSQLRMAAQALATGSIGVDQADQGAVVAGCAALAAALGDLPDTARARLLRI